MNVQGLMNLEHDHSKSLCVRARWVYCFGFFSILACIYPFFVFHSLHAMNEIKKISKVTDYYKICYVSRTYLRSILRYIRNLVLDTWYRLAGLCWSWGTIWQSSLFLIIVIVFWLAGFKCTESRIQSSHSSQCWLWWPH